MDEIYDFHEAKHPGNFYRNHLDFIVSSIAGRVNRYVLIPYMGVQSFHDGISHQKGTILTIGSLEALCFVLFVTYFGPTKKSDLLGLISPTHFRTEGTKVATGYAKGNILWYPYLYKMLKNFPEKCPQSYCFIMKVSFVVHDLLKPIS